MRMQPLFAENHLPLLCEPESDAERDGKRLAETIASRRVELEKALTERGALLFRGFSPIGPAEFERAARALAPDLKKDYLGTSPRDALTEYVFSASELPGYFPIPQHLEMSFVKDPPRRLFFGCLRPNQGPGGETPLVDFRRVARDLDPGVRAKFERLGVRNVRNYAGPSGGSRFDLWKLKRWDEMFGTTDRGAVEAKCRENGFEWRWREPDRLQLVNVQPALRAHPETGEPVWFNHAQVFHLGAAPGEYRRIARRLGPRWLGLWAFSAALVAAKRAFVRPDDQAMDSTYGDGSPISDAEMEAVREAIWKNLVAFPWKQGDVLAIDNRSVSHGRMPYSGPRAIAVCWA
jgi:alpha-ketoglutarate-dependent taurine dioxygenase